MEVTIGKKVEFALLGRTSVEATVKFDAATPNRGNLEKAIADKLKVEPALVIAEHVYSDFGSRSAKIQALVYKDAKHKALYTVVPGKVIAAKAKERFDAVRKAATEKKEAAAAAAPAQ